MARHESTSSDDVPLSPTSRPSYRVSKPGQKTVRKPSLGPNAINRMDPNSINMMNPYGPLPGSANGVGSIPGPFAAAFPNGYGQQGPGVIRPAGSFQMPAAALVGDIVTNGTSQPFYPISTNMPLMPNAPSDVSPTGSAGNEITETPSCCSGASGASSVARHTPSSSLGSISHEAPAPVVAPKTGGSCCGPKAPPPLTQPFKGFSTPIQTRNGTNGMQPFPLGPAFDQQVHSSNYEQATIFMLPSGYGSSQQPVNHAQWHQNIDTYAYPQSVPQPLMPFANGSVKLDTNGSAPSPETTGTAHECCCGPSCNCIGCAAHPFNQATHDYIASAIKSQDGKPILEGFDPTISGHIQSLSQPKTEDVSPAETPSDTTSTIGHEDQVYSANEYYFFQYQFCEGQGETCPCGDDCQCIGCIIHGNNVPA